MPGYPVVKKRGPTILALTLRLAALLCGIALAILAWRRHQREAPERAIAEIEKLGGQVEGLGPILTLSCTPGQSPGNRPIFLVDFGGRDFTDAELAAIRPQVDYLPELRTLMITSSSITDEGIKHIAGLTKLEYLDLSGNRRITSMGVEQLATLTELEYLDLSGTNATAEGLLRLKGLRNLKFILFNYTDFSDSDIVRIFAERREEHFWPELILLDVGGTRVTEAGINTMNSILAKNIEKYNNK